MEEKGENGSLVGLTLREWWDICCEDVITIMEPQKVLSILMIVDQPGIGVIHSHIYSLESAILTTCIHLPLLSRIDC